MKLVLKGRESKLNEALRAFVEDRVIDKVSPLSGKIQSMTISSRDINGPRGGIDHVALVVIQLTSGKRIVVRNQTLDPYAGAIAAVKKAVQLVRRERGRRRTNLREAYRQNLLEQLS